MVVELSRGAMVVADGSERTCPCPAAECQPPRRPEAGRRVRRRVRPSLGHQGSP